MTVRDKLASLAIGLPLLALAGIVADAQQPTRRVDAEYIAMAMTAAPADVAQGAAIVRMGSAAQTLKKGTNEYTCMVVNAGAMCMSPIATEWAHAWQTHTPPPNELGFIYMLSGDQGMSNTDPWATKRTPYNHWVKTGPNVMMVGLPVKKMQFPRTPDPDPTKPYVMWSGTPYEHVMIPLNRANGKLTEELRDAARVVIEAASNISDPSLIQAKRDMRADAEVLLAHIPAVAR